MVRGVPSAVGVSRSKYDVLWIHLFKSKRVSMMDNDDSTTVRMKHELWGYKEHRLYIRMGAWPVGGSPNELLKVASKWPPSLAVPRQEHIVLLSEPWLFSQSYKKHQLFQPMQMVAQIQYQFVWFFCCATVRKLKDSK